MPYCIVYNNKQKIITDKLYYPLGGLTGAAKDPWNSHYHPDYFVNIRQQNNNKELCFGLPIYFTTISVDYVCLAVRYELLPFKITIKDFDYEIIQFFTFSKFLPLLEENTGDKLIDVVQFFDAKNNYYGGCRYDI